MEIEAKLSQGVDDAVETVLKAVKSDYWAARDLLRAFGAMIPRASVTIERGQTLEELVAGSHCAEQNEDSQ